MKRFATLSALSLFLVTTVGFVKAQTDFTAKGLNYEVEIMNIYSGNFEEVPFDRKGMLFSTLFNTYISNFAKRCPNSLPENKIQLMDRQCSEEQITRNGFGIETSRICIKWVDVPSDLYADPKMFAAMEELKQYQLGNVLSMMDQNGGLGNSVRMTGEMKAVYMDMAALIGTNGCGNKGLMRFQENLRRFALGEPAIRDETMISARKSDKAVLSKNQDLNRLMEDLVYQNSRQWNFNRYEEGSVDNVAVTNTNSAGLPTMLRAEYVFAGWGGRKKGSVTLTFTQEGLPDCLYFFDFPDTCRPASRKIVNAYGTNNYAAN